MTFKVGGAMFAKVRPAAWQLAQPLEIPWWLIT
jgi:hypothetical protein